MILVQVASEHQSPSLNLREILNLIIINDLAEVTTISETHSSYFSNLEFVKFTHITNLVLSRYLDGLQSTVPIFYFS